MSVLFVKVNLILIAATILTYQTFGDIPWNTFGTLRSPKINNLLIPNYPWGQHITLNQISTENLPTTNNIPVSISTESITYQDSYNVKRTHKKLDLFQTRGWLCELVVLFFNSNSSANFDHNFANVIGQWIHYHTQKHFTHSEIPKDEYFNMNHFRVLLVTIFPQSYFKDSPYSLLYSPHLPDYSRIFAKYFAIFLLTWEEDEFSQLCQPIDPDGVPNFMNMKCGQLHITWNWNHNGNQQTDNNWVLPPDLIIQNEPFFPSAFQVSDVSLYLIYVLTKSVNATIHNHKSVPKFFDCFNNFNTGCWYPTFEVETADMWIWWWWGWI